MAQSYARPQAQAAFSTSKLPSYFATSISATAWPTRPATGTTLGRVACRCCPSRRRPISRWPLTKALCGTVRFLLRAMPWVGAAGSSGRPETHYGRTVEVAPGAVEPPVGLGMHQVARPAPDGAGGGSGWLLGRHQSSSGQRKREQKVISHQANKEGKPAVIGAQDGTWATRPRFLRLKDPR